MSQQTVLIIGAGPCGLSLLRSFQTARLKQAQNKMPRFSCIEKSQQQGGQWNYTWRVGTDKHGETVSSCMYKNLWINGPKQLFELPDYSFKQHFKGVSIPSFIPREIFRNYIMARFNQHDLKKYIKFQTIARRVTYDEDLKKFRVIIKDLKANKEQEFLYDYVINATGHYSVPYRPNFECLNNYQGFVVHASEVKTFNQFKNLNLLVVGASYSAEDITLQALKFGCKTVTVSSRQNQQFTYQWPKQKVFSFPMFQEAKGNTIKFKNGVEKEIDVIVLCTGYLYHYPFLQDKLNMKTKYNSFWPQGLYKGVVWIDQPKLFYIGVQNQAVTFPLFDIQSILIRDFILGKVSLPTKAQMFEDSKAWGDKLSIVDKTNFHKIMLFISEYFNDMMKIVDYPNFSIDKLVELYMATYNSKKPDPLGFRDLTYISAISGQQSVKHSVKWVDEFRDTEEEFLKEYLNMKTQ